MSVRGMQPNRQQPGGLSGQDLVPWSLGTGRSDALFYCKMPLLDFHSDKALSHHRFEYGLNREGVVVSTVVE